MPVKIFFCYAHEDEALLDKLKMHLRPLQRQNLIDVWYDRNISAGTEWIKEIDKHLNTADIVLLLVSPAFMDSDYCYSIEMKRAIERHEQGQAHVIPIILEYVYWQIEPLTSLQALPKDAKPIVSASWHSQNEAFYNVVEGIRKVVDELSFKPTNSLQETSIQQKKIDAPQRFVNIPQRDEVKREDFFLLRYNSAGDVTSIVFSPGGQLLASGSYDGFIRLWNPNTGIILRTLVRHSDCVMSVAFSPDGQLLASGGYDKSIRLWNPNTGALLRTLAGHSGYVFSVIFSPDGQLLASGSYDRSIKLWNPYTGTLLRTLTGHSDGIRSVTFSPDGQLLASGSLSENNAIIIWGKKDDTR